MKTLIARPDSNGDVLLAEPAIRAVAEQDNVDLLVSDQGLAAAELIPRVRRLLVHQLPWIDADPEAVTSNKFDLLIDEVKQGQYDRAIILSSYHQNALPLALAFRLAGVPWIAARSEDYPGSLLDLRFRGDDNVHEVERSLMLVEECGYSVPADKRIRIRFLEAFPLPEREYVVVHPGGTAESRRWAPEHWREVVALLRQRFDVLVTGGEQERELTEYVAGDIAHDLGGKTSFSQLATLIGSAKALISGNTAAVHVASAVHTPVVLLFSPVVPIERWHPWLIPFQLLGNQQAACSGTRVRNCLVPGHPCLNSITADEVFESTLYLIGES